MTPDNAFKPERFGFTTNAKIAWLKNPHDGTVEYLFCWLDNSAHVIVEVWTGSTKKSRDHITKQDGRAMWNSLIKRGYMRRLPGVPE